MASPDCRSPACSGTSRRRSRRAELPAVATLPEADELAARARASRRSSRRRASERLAEVERVSAHVELSLTELLQRADEEIGRAASDVEQKLPGAEGRLAQAETRHAELLARRDRRRTELERQRALTLQAVERLASVLVLPHPEREAPEVRRLKPNLETEATAMRVVMEHERRTGRQVYDVSEKNLGYDVTSLDLASGELRLIEVKGIGAATGTILLTPNERRVAEDRRDCYWLYVVTDCSTAPAAPGADPRPGAPRLERGDEGGALLPGGERDDEADAGARGRAALRGEHIVTRQPPIGQRGRLIILVLYLVGLLVASRAAMGSWIPPTSAEGIWFYAALAALLLGGLLVTPFFTNPANAIAYAVASLVTLLPVNPWVASNASGFDHLTWLATLLYVILVLAAAISAISLKDSSRPFAQKAARSALLLAEAAGSPRAIFSAVFLFALITYHRSDPRQYLIIGLAWALFVGLRPLEAIAKLWRRWRILWLTRQEPPRLGQVVGHKAPGVVLIREDVASGTQFGDLLFARTESGEPGVLVALDHVGFASGRWLRAIHLKAATVDTPFLQDPSLCHAVSQGTVFVAAESNRLAEDTNNRLVGLVAADTKVGQLQFELVRADIDLHEGSLVEVEVDGRPVLYQVITGLTKEEVLQEKNTRGFVRAQAKKIGFWNSDRQSFDPVPWLPQPNQPVLLVGPTMGADAKEAIGHFPGTAYPVCVDPDLLVTHNAAVLGILGVGKSFLALELVERMIQAGIKVICLDLTNQYQLQLSSFYDQGAHADLMSRLLALGPNGKTAYSRNPDEGGNVGDFVAEIRRALGDFLAPEQTDNLLFVLNPSGFEVWRQTANWFNNPPPMAVLTPTEITRIITEGALAVLQGHGMVDKARCCVVYEEAHSLIPEWNAVASDGDKAATNGTAKAILQGRKFGLGCLVVTQRTANVTKTILNQCNTIFGLRVFDATGMEFLKNYIGEDYAGVLSTLEDRHAVVFGRASSCRDPVLTRLNDRADFLRVFRQPEPVPENEETAE